MTLYAWMMFIAITLLQAGSPGPSTLNLIKNSIRFGAPQAILILTGDVTAILLMGLISSFGIARLFADNPRTFMALKLVGAIYLVYLGIRTYANSRASTRLETGVHGIEKNGIGAQWIRSFFIGMSNPKSMIYFAALLPQFETHGQPDLAFFSLLVLCSALIKLVVLSFYATLATWLVDRFSSPSSGRLGTYLVAVFFVFFGTTVACSAIH